MFGMFSKKKEHKSDFVIEESDEDGRGFVAICT